MKLCTKLDRQCHQGRVGIVPRRPARRHADVELQLFFCYRAVGPVGAETNLN